MEDKKIVKNRVRCTKCGQIIESTSASQYSICSCGATRIKGGYNELIREGEGCFEELTQYYLKA